MPTIYVCGHVTPATDAIASAMGYAWVLAQGSQDEVVAARAGSINAQTSWALHRLGLEGPELLPDASPPFESVSRRLDTAPPRAAVQRARGDRHPNRRRRPRRGGGWQALWADQRPELLRIPEPAGGDTAGKAGDASGGVPRPCPPGGPPHAPRRGSP